MIKMPDETQAQPFGYLNQEWNAFKSAMRDGDQIYRVEFAIRTDQPVKGAGYWDENVVLVREGCVIKKFLLSIT